MCILHHRFQQVIVWLPLSTVCSIAAALHGWSKPDASWPRKYWTGQYKDVLGKRSDKSLSNKTLADSFYNDQLPSCFPTAQSAQKNITEKAHTLSHLLSYSNRIKQQQKQKAHHIVSTQLLSTGSMKSSVWPPLSLVYSAVTPHQQSIPDTFSARQCWKKVKTWMGYLFNTVHNNKLTTDPPKSQ